MAKIGSVWPASLASERVANGAQADAEIPQMLAGRARWLYEMASGASAVDGEPASVPVNPQGRIGHDHSGPPYGSALKHRLFGWSGTRDDLASVAFFNGRTNVYALSTTDDPAIRLLGRAWVKPFVDFTGAPYSQGALVVIARCESSTQQVDIEMQANGGAIIADSFTATTTRTLFQIANRIPLRPGWNDVSIALQSDLSPRVWVTSISVHQVAKRAH